MSRTLWRRLPGCTAAAIAFISLTTFLIPASVGAEVRGTSPVIEDQGILPNSGPVEVFRIDPGPTQKVVPRDVYAGDGYIGPIRLFYSYIDPNEYGRIGYFATETPGTGVPGTIRFAVERINRSDPACVPSNRNWETCPTWSRKQNPDYQPEPLLPDYEPWLYLGARVGPGAGPGEPFEGSDAFYVGVANPYAGKLTFFIFLINELGFDGQVTETDFSKFFAFVDNGHDVFDPDPLADVPAGPSAEPFYEGTIRMTTPSGALVNVNCFVAGERELV